MCMYNLHWKWYIIAALGKIVAQQFQIAYEKYLKKKPKNISMPNKKGCFSLF